MIALIFDTETTGLIKHPDAKDEIQPRIIEWSGVLWEKGEVIEEASWLFNPGIPLEPVITKITGLTDEDLAGQPKFWQEASGMEELFERAGALIAHNLPFDRGMMELELGRARLLDDWPWPKRQICTVQEHAEEFGHRPKLTELYHHYMGEPLAQTHRALDDVRALVAICEAARILK